MHGVIVQLKFVMIKKNKNKQIIGVRGIEKLNPRNITCLNQFF